MALKKVSRDHQPELEVDNAEKIEEMFGHVTAEPPAATIEQITAAEEAAGNLTPEPAAPAAEVSFF